MRHYLDDFVKSVEKRLHFCTMLVVIALTL